jgi:hypothetical protein
MTALNFGQRAAVLTSGFALLLGLAACSSSGSTGSLNPVGATTSAPAGGAQSTVASGGSQPSSSAAASQGDPDAKQALAAAQKYTTNLMNSSTTSTSIAACPIGDPAAIVSTFMGGLGLSSDLAPKGATHNENDNLQPVSAKTMCILGSGSAAVPTVSIDLQSSTVRADPMSVCALFSPCTDDGAVSGFTLVSHAFQDSGDGATGCEIDWGQSPVVVTVRGVFMAAASISDGSCSAAGRAVVPILIKDLTALS